MMTPQIVMTLMLDGVDVDVAAEGGGVWVLMLVVGGDVNVS
jgi:hypothetical protein